MALVYFYFYYITSQSLYSITQRIRISRLTTTPESTTPTLYEQCVGSLTSHSINIGKDCETGPTVFRPYPRRLESLTICRCHYKGSTFFSVIVKTLSVGPAGAWTRDLPRRGSSVQANHFIGPIINWHVTWKPSCNPWSTGDGILFAEAVRLSFVASFLFCLISRWCQMLLKSLCILRDVVCEPSTAVEVNEGATSEYRTL